MAQKMLTGGHPSEEQLVLELGVGTVQSLTYFQDVIRMIVGMGIEVDSALVRKP